MRHGTVAHVARAIDHRDGRSAGVRRWLASGIPSALVCALVALAAGCATRAPRPVQTPAGASGSDEAQSVRLLLRLGERRLYLLDGDPTTPDPAFPIAVGRPGHETPTGHFRVEEMVEHPDFVRIEHGDPPRVRERVPPGPENPLGERWIGFIRGDGWTIGIHGTPRPELLGQAVSRGCIRMRNADVIRVYDRVRIGTPVVVEP